MNVIDLKGRKHQRIKESNETVQQFVKAVLRYACKNCFLLSVMCLFCRLLCDPLMTVVEEEGEMRSLHTSHSIFMVALLRESTGKKCCVFYECLCSILSVSRENLNCVTPTLAYF